MTARQLSPKFSEPAWRVSVVYRGRVIWSKTYTDEGRARTRYNDDRRAKWLTADHRVTFEERPVGSSLFREVPETQPPPPSDPGPRAA